MKHPPFSELFEKSPCILGEGAVIERLRRNSDFELDPHIVNSAFVYDEAKRAAVEAHLPAVPGHRLRVRSAAPPFHPYLAGQSGTD